MGSFYNLPLSTCEKLKAAKEVFCKSCILSLNPFAVKYCTNPLNGGTKI
jgi:hypothetical protein